MDFLFGFIIGCAFGWIFGYKRTQDARRLKAERWFNDSPTYQEVNRPPSQPYLPLTPPAPVVVPAPKAKAKPRVKKAQSVKKSK